MTAIQRAALPREVRQVVRDLLPYDPERVILSASLARGDSDDYSDIDIIVVKQMETRFVQRLVDAGRFISLPRHVDMFAHTPEELSAMEEERKPFIESSLRDGIVVYKKPGRDLSTMSRTSGTPASGLGQGT